MYNSLLLRSKYQLNSKLLHFIPDSEFINF